MSLFIKCRIAKINIMKQKEFDLTFEQFNDVFQIYEQLQINSPQSKNVEEEASDSPCHQLCAAMHAFYQRPSLCSFGMRDLF